MKRIIILMLTMAIGFSCLGCSTQTKPTDADEKSADTQETDNDSVQEISCSEVGHDYSLGVCTRCGEIVQVNMRERVGNPNSFYFVLNSADGIKACWIAANLSGKNVKYCSLEFSFYNSVGDHVYDDITGDSGVVIRLVGPMEAGHNFSLLDEIIGYSGTCYKISLDAITLEYMDGSKETGAYGWSVTEGY